MQLLRGNMWQEVGTADLLLVTTNSELNASKLLIMGKGSARDAVQRYPDIQRIFTELILRCRSGRDRYGLLISDVVDHGTRIGALQTKYSWRNVANLDLIRFSLACLCHVANQYQRIVLPMPGVGAGKLFPGEVLPLLEGLPDHVIVYHR